MKADRQTAAAWILAGSLIGGILGFAGVSDPVTSIAHASGLRPIDVSVRGPTVLLAEEARHPVFVDEFEGFDEPHPAYARDVFESLEAESHAPSEQSESPAS